MKHNTFLRILCLALVLCTVLALCACPASTDGPGTGETPGGETPGGETPGGETPGGETPGGETPGGETPGGETPGGGEEPPAPEKPVPDVYADATPVAGSGATLADGSFALTAPSYDESTAESVRANSFFRTTEKEAGKVFRVSGTGPLTIVEEGTYDGEGSILIAAGGVTISYTSNVTLKNITIIGSLSVEGGTNVTMENVAVISEGTALTVDADSDTVMLNGCRLVGKTAAAFAGSETAILNSYLGFTEVGVADTAVAGTTVLNCVLEGSGIGITSSSSDSAFRSNTLKMAAADTGIRLEAGIQNGLVALNVITGAQKSLAISGVENVSVVLNSFVSAEANGNRNLYICDNNMGGRLTANNNNYFIADCNTTPDDEWNHETVQTGNQNHNGDSLMDVTARPEVGADEALLPHVDKDLFVGMERKSNVKDLTDSSSRNLSNYITEHAKTDEYIIIAPGAYAVLGGMSFNAQHSNTKIYAYGVYMERQSDLYGMITVSGASDIMFKGLTIGFQQQSCGQVYILEKMGGNQVRVVTGAGMMNEFGNTNTRYFDTTTVGAHRAGTDFAYCDTGFRSIRKDSNGTMIMTLDSSVYSMVNVGDIFTCRANNGSNSITIATNSKDIVFYDFTLYGNAGSFAFMEYDTLTGTTYYRVYDTTRSGEIIDEEIYDAYRALEETYHVDLQISIDDKGRCRGSVPQIGSVDATHSSKCAEGSQATFCIFENMCDDATNQGHFSSRLHEVVDNGNGTVTITYKGVLTNNNFRYDKFAPDVMCYDFKAGDRVYIYTANGQLICDTEALSDTVSLGDRTITHYGATVKMPMRKITISSDAISEKAWAALAEYDLSLNTVDDQYKVLIDNMSMASNGFKFDNCTFQNIRSRGLLIKASDGLIQNCTFRNIGCACASLQYEIFWGEAGVTENMLIDRNLFENTGYFAPSNYNGNDKEYATAVNGYSPISIAGLGSQVDEDFLLYRDITISNNKVVDRATRYAVYINSAKDIKLINNDFGIFGGNDFTKKPEAVESMDNPIPVIRIYGAMNIEISGNKFPDTGLVQDQIIAEKKKNIFGSDVVIHDPFVGDVYLVPDDE